MAEKNEVKSLLIEYQDLFSLSNDKIGRANIVEFDIDTFHLKPVAVRAATVLVKRKNVAGSVDYTDKYRICTDHRLLNSVIPNIGWPNPSLCPKTS